MNYLIVLFTTIHENTPTLPLWLTFGTASVVDVNTVSLFKAREDVKYDYS